MSWSLTSCASQFKERIDTSVVLKLVQICYKLGEREKEPESVVWSS